jgi:hypothetical protein
MDADAIRAIAHRLVEQMVLDHPDAAAQIAALVLTEILATCLFGDGDPADVAAFVAAINLKLDEVALHHGETVSWKLVPAQPPQRH